MISFKRKLPTVCAVAILSGLTAVAHAGTVAVDVQSPGQQFVAFNTSDKPITPRVIARGWTDREGFPPRHAVGLRLNGLEIAPARMLTGATWIVEPDGTAKWGYRTGSWNRADGTPEDPRFWIYDPDRMALDHWPPLEGKPAAIITVAYNGQPHNWFCRIDFPHNASITTFHIACNSEQCGEGRRATPVARLYADPDRQKLLAERTIDFASNAFVFDGKTLPKTFYLELIGKDVKVKTPVGLYWVTFSAELAVTNPPRLTLQPGVNVITVEDSPESSHQWRVVLEDQALRDNPPRTPDSPMPDFVKNHRSRFRDKPVTGQKVVAPADFFPLGVYHGLTTDALDFAVDDLADMNCNCVYGSNMFIEQLETILDLLDRANVKLVYQGASPGSLIYFHRGYYGGDAQKEIEVNRTQFVPAARTHVPRFRNRPGLLAWSIGEEVSPDVPERLTSYYKLLRELDPTHPPVFLHNSFEAAKNDLALNRPAALTYDCYAFTLDPQCNPTTTSASLNTYLGYTRRYRQLCDAADVPFWLMGQTWGEPSCEDLASPPYDRHYGMRKLPASLVRMQGWAAVAEGARGVFFFMYRQYADMEACRDRYWRKNERWQGAKQLFGELQPVTPLLLRLKRAEDQDARLAPKESGSMLVVRAFHRREKAGADRGLYAVVFNSDEAKSCPLTLSGPAMEKAEVVWDYKQKKPVAAEAMLEPGEGTVLWIGAKDQPAVDAVGK